MLALLALVLVLLLVPAWLAPPVEAPRFEQIGLPPLSIDVESAAWYEWATLEGIGEVRARRIVEWIEAHRPLSRLEDLEQIGGLPRGWLERARPSLQWEPTDRSGEATVRNGEPANGSAAKDSGVVSSVESRDPR